MSNQKFQHFSHPHSLISLTKEQAEDINCKACGRRIIESFHGCAACKYYLHDECLNAPRFLDHPSHTSHHLTLLPFPTYPDSRFKCDGCGANGNTFIYSCSMCNFDLRMHCALSPLTVLLDKHPHELKLIFDPAIRLGDAIFKCDICHFEGDLKNWLYYCCDCDFGTHLHCAIPDRWPTMLDQPKADKEAGDTGNVLVTTAQPSGQKSEGTDHLSLAIDEVMEIQIMLARLQNQLSKAQMKTSPP